MSGQAEGQVFGFAAEKLNREIADRHLTTEDAARLVGVTTKTMQRWRKERATPQMRHLRAIASAFDRDPSWFFSEPERKAA